MIKINKKIFELKHFPDNTLLARLDFGLVKHALIEWFYESDEELFALICITKHLKKINSSLVVDLFLPYVPHARMDRCKAPEDVFTLKYFAETINSLNFNKVIALDPHSSVSEALIDRLKVESPEQLIRNVIKNVTELTGETPLLFYPDEGAMKRYSGMIQSPYAFGIKKRDWKTGDILGLDVVGEIKKDKPVLIVDDISSYGTTFMFSAKKLKELGAGNVFLYVTHCEKSIFGGDLYQSELIEKVFTTNSIFTEVDEWVDVYNVSLAVNKLL